MHKSNQGTTSHKDQKNIYKYYMKCDFKYDERAFLKEKIKNRDFVTWNVSINRSDWVDVKWLRQLPAIKSAKKLQKINIHISRGNGIKDEWLQEFSDILKRLSALQNLHIYLDSPWITNNGIQALGEVLKKLNNLKTLSLSSQCFTMNGLKTLTRTLKEMHPLQKIFIGFSDGSWSLVGGFNEDFQRFSSFNNPHLGSFGMLNQGLKGLSEDLKELGSLKNVHLGTLR